MTPFQVLYGKLPRAIQTYLPSTSPIEAVDSELSTREGVLAQLKKNLLKAQKRMKLQANVHRRDVIFQEGDQVMVKLHLYKQQSLAKRLNYKLSQRY